MIGLCEHFFQDLVVVIIKVVVYFIKISSYIGVVNTVISSIDSNYII